MTKERRLHPFLEKVVNFDFEKCYVKKTRIFSHILIWIIFTFIIQIGYFWGYKFSFGTSVLFAARITLCNITVFYLLFYFVIPQTINKNRFFLFLVSIFGLLQVWLIVNHYYYIILYNLNIDLDYGVLKEMLVKNKEKTLLDIIKPQNVLAYSFDIISAISPVLFLKITFDLSRTYANSVKANREIEKLNYENLLMENKFLQTQLNPHFLFNTLNNIYSLALKKSELTPEIVLKLSSIMKYTLYDANVKKISIDRELEFIDDYFDMEKMRYPNEYIIEKTVINNGRNIEIEPLLPFVFIENAFKYGLKSDNPFLKIFIKADDFKVYFKIENDSNNNISSKKHGYGGIGLENIKRRLNLLYPDKHIMSINTQSKKFTVELEIKLN